MLLCWWITGEIIRFEYLEPWTASCRFRCWKRRSKSHKHSPQHGATLLSFVTSFVTCVHASDYKAGKDLWEIPKPGVKRISQSHPHLSPGWDISEQLSRLLFSCQMLLKAKRGDYEFVTVCDTDRAGAAQCCGGTQDVVPTLWNLLPTFCHVFEGELAPREMSCWPGNPFSIYFSCCGIDHAVSELRTTLSLPCPVNPARVQVSAP